jgi:phage tail-like protein
MENEIPNYFVLNKHSELWKDSSLYSDKGFVSLTPSYSFSLKTIINIPLRLTNFNDNSPKTEDVLTDPSSLFSFDLDKYNMLYILEKDTKKIRRISLDRYEQYNTGNTDNIVFDEYIILCKGLENPQSIVATNRHIYVLDNSTLYVLSKVDYNLIKTINFRDRLDLFKITEDEGVLIYSYSGNRTVLYEKNLVWDYESSGGDGDEHQIINLSKSEKLDEDFTDSYVSDRNKENDNEDNYNTYGQGNSKSSDNGGYVNNYKVFENIIDVSINNKLKILYVLTYRNLFVFDFDGKSIVDPINIRDRIGDEFNPTSLAIDEENNDIFIGNTTKYDGLAFPRKLRFGKNMIPTKEYEIEKIGIQGQSWKVFLTPTIKHGASYSRLSALNIVPNKDKNDDNSSSNRDEKKNGVTSNENNFREATNLASSAHISCEIFEEKPSYQTQTFTTLTTKSLDSLEERTKWSKVTIDSDIPPNTYIKLSYFCSNKDITPRKDQWISGSVNNNNVLILDSVGRYLKLKVDLSSLDKETSPRFYKMTVYFSMHTYLQFLPEIYQEDEQGKIFLEKFLGIFQTLFEETENKIYSFIKYLDVRATPEEFLPWLSSWLSLSFNEGWGSENVRSFLERAPDIFRKRGTREGLEDILSMYILYNEKNNSEKQSHSQSQQRTEGNNKKNDSNLMEKDIENRLDKGDNYFFILDGRTELNELSKKLNESFVKDLVEGDSSDLLPYCFYVFLNPLLLDDTRSEAIKRIIEKEKPAHTVAIVRRLKQWSSLGRGTYVGLDKVIGGRYRFELGKSYVSVDTLLSSVEV